MRPEVVTTLGEGEYCYEVVQGWAQIPPDIAGRDIAAVAIGPNDDVYLFTRGPHPVMVLNAAGELLRTWGHGVFTRPHGVDIAGGAIYCTDDGDHTVRRFNLEGRLELTIGVPGRPAPFMSGRPFHRCTHTALSPGGYIYVSDGYGNAAVHKFDPAGRRLMSWGASGAGPGEFYLPHNLACDTEGWVYVADRENHRIQVFDGDGRYETEWRALHRPCALCMARTGRRRYYVGELGPALEATLGFPNLGPRISVLGEAGEVLARLAAGPAGLGPGQFIAPHGIAVDSRGDIYAAELSYRAWPLVFPGVERPAELPTLHKLRRLG